MAFARRSSSREFAMLFGVVVAVGGLLQGNGCIIADPPVEFSRLPPSAPRIVRATPPPSFVMGTFPQTFDLWVELSNPTDLFKWSAFIDYDPADGRGFIDSRDSPTDRESLEGRIRHVQVSLPTQGDRRFDLDRCHVVEIVVAFGFREGSGFHAPDGRGGDSMTWFYSPGGDLQGCPSLDAGTVVLSDADATP